MPALSGALAVLIIVPVAYMTWNNMQTVPPAVEMDPAHDVMAPAATEPAGNVPASAAMKKVSPASPAPAPAPTPAAAGAMMKAAPEPTSLMMESAGSEDREQTTWNTDLTPEQLHILRDAGTETPYTSPLLDEHRKGTYVSADCNEPVFRSEQKFDSGTGWPSFWAPITPDAVVEKTDSSYGVRTEILSKCGGHLGHVFTDGPQPTGLRYCMNGLALKFIPDEKQ